MTPEAILVTGAASFFGFHVRKRLLHSRELVSGSTISTTITIPPSRKPDSLIL